MGSIPGLKDSLCRKWQHTPVFLPGKSYGQRRLVAYSLWGGKELDTTVWLSMHTHTHTHTHLLLPVAVMLSDDALNTEWIILTTGPWGNTVGSWKPLVTTFSSTDQYVTCLETPYSIPIADSSTLNSRPIALWLLLECSLSDKCIFLTRHIPASFLFHFKKLNSDMYQYKYWYSILFSDDFLL